MSTTPTRFLVIERPHYSVCGATFYPDEDAPTIAPVVGDVVEFVQGPDDDGDVMVTDRNGRTWDISRADLFPLDLALDILRNA